MSFDCYLIFDEERHFNTKILAYNGKGNIQLKGHEETKEELPIFFFSLFSANSLNVLLNQSANRATFTFEGVLSHEQIVL